MPKGETGEQAPGVRERGGRARQKARAADATRARSAARALAALLPAIVGGVLALAGAAPAAAGGDTLVFLGNSNIPPVVYLDRGAPAGVAVDLVHELARRMPQPVEMRAMDWAEAQALVAAGKADALVQINATDERRKIYDFSDTLLESRFSIFVGSQRLGVSGASSLRGLRVGVEAAGLPRQVLEKDPGVQLRIIPSFLDGFRLLNAGTIDAVVVDQRVGAYVIAQNGLRGIRIAGDPIAFSYSSFAVRKGNAPLLAAIDRALRSIKADGTYDRVLEKWKPAEVVFETRAQVTRRTLYAALGVLVALVIVAVLWTVTLSRQLVRRKAAEAKLREQHSTLQSIIAGANALIFCVDRQYRYTTFDPGHAAMMKALYGADIEPGGSILACMTVARDRETARRNFNRALAGEQFTDDAYSGEEHSRRYFTVSHSPIRSGSEVIGVSVLAHDITELEQTRAALRRSETSYRTIVATMGEGVMVLGADGAIATMNPTAERILGRPAGDMLGHTLDEVVCDALRVDGSPFPAAEHPCLVTLRTGEPQSSVIVGLRAPDGSRRWISINSQPVRDQQADAPRAVVSTFQDITERLQNEAIATARLHLIHFSVSHSLDELLEETLNETERLTGSLIGFLHFIDEDQQSLTLQAWSARTRTRYCKAAGKGLHYPMAQAGVWVDCVRERRGVIHNDYESLPHRKGLPPGHAPLLRELVVPVMRGDRLLAILGVGNKPIDYTDKDLETVSLIADIAWDIADRKRAEEEQRQLNRELRAISNCNQTLMRARDEQTLLADICRIVCNEAGYRMAWVGYAEHDEGKTVRPVSWDGDGDPPASGVTWGEAPGSDEPAGKAIRTGAVVCIQDLAASGDEPWRRQAMRRGHRSIVAMPLFDGGGKAFGVLCIHAAKTHAFTPEEMRLLEELSGDLAFGVTVLRARADLERAERERLDQVRFLESLDRVGRIIQRTADADRIMDDVLDVVLSIFDCDRAFLLTPCDPDAAAWSVRMERTRAECPEVAARGGESPADPEVAQAMRILLDNDGPVAFGPGAPHPLPKGEAARLGAKSLLSMAVRPKSGPPWKFGIHDCSHARAWTAWEQRLFGEIGRRIGEALTSQQMYRDLCAREREFRGLAENSPDVIIRYDRQCRRVYVNPEFERVNGLTPGQALGKTPLQLSTRLAPVAPTFVEQIKRVMETGVTTKIDLAWDRDGVHHCWYVRVVPEYDEPGEVASVLTIWSDITELKATEATIRKLNADLSATLQAIPDLLFDLDSKGTYLDIWARDTSLLFADKQFLLGRTVAEVLSPEAAAVVMASLEEAGRSGSSFGHVMHLDFDDGERWFELSVSRKEAGDGPGARFIVLSREITKRKRAEDAVNRLNQELEQRVAGRTAELERANAELQAFSYSVSHDLRAPLAAIGGFSTVLLQKHGAGLDDGARHYLERIHLNAARMSALIDDILAFSRTSQGEMTVAPVDMQALAREVFEEARAAAPQRRIVLELGELPPARGDRAMLRQVFVNLLSNAVKYTSPREEARIEIGASRQPQGNTYWVRDNGVGFDPQYADKLFGVFQRLHGATEFEGTGIGLAIVKRIVLRHGGRAWAQGKPDEGACVSFTLPPA